MLDLAMALKVVAVFGGKFALGALVKHHFRLGTKRIL